MLQVIIKAGLAAALAIAALTTCRLAMAADNNGALTAPTSAPAAEGVETGLAAVYTNRLRGHRTASGARYDPTKLTAAHKTLPFGSRVKVTNSRNGKSVVVRINDRGPKQADRILDISPRAARAIGIGSHSMAKVTAETIH